LTDGGMCPTEAAAWQDAKQVLTAPVHMPATGAGTGGMSVTGSTGDDVQLPDDVSSTACLGWRDSGAPIAGSRVTLGPEVAEEQILLVRPEIVTRAEEVPQAIPAGRRVTLTDTYEMSGLPSVVLSGGAVRVQASVKARADNGSLCRNLPAGYFDDSPVIATSGVVEVSKNGPGTVKVDVTSADVDTCFTFAETMLEPLWPAGPALEHPHGLPAQTMILRHKEETPAVRVAAPPPPTPAVPPQPMAAPPPLTLAKTGSRVGLPLEVGLSAITFGAVLVVTGSAVRQHRGAHRRVK
jgi:hypothetical protein